MRIYSYLGLFILLSFFSAELTGQTQRAFRKAADEAFASNNYHEALRLYREVLLFKDDQWEVVWLAGESANELYAYEVAEEYYRRLRANELMDSFPLLDVRLGIQNKRLGDYEAAVGYFKRFLNAYKGGDPYYIEKANYEIEACEWANTNTDTISGFEVERYGDMVNSPATENGPVEFNDVLYYTSLRYKKVEDNYDPPRNIGKVLRYKEDGMARLVGGDLNAENKYTSFPAFSPDGKKIYFTHCDYIDQAEIPCDIYVREIISDTTFGEPVRLPEKINLPNTTSTQPSLGIDPESGNEILYFVSDRPGGKGKLDIWYSIIDENGNFSDPKNLEAVNTFDDDISPFFHSESGTLYFSSMGHKGYGAHDVFMVKNVEGEWTEVKNIGKPINTAYNDLNFSLDKRKAKGYLASNRPGSNYYDEDLEACCFDIYKVRAITLSERIELTTYEEQPLPYTLNLERYEKSLLNIIIIDEPKHGSIEMPMVEQTGKLTYIPDPGFSGRDSVTLIKCFDQNQDLCDTTILDITVLPMPIDTIEVETPMNTPIKDCYDLVRFDDLSNLTTTICQEPEYGKAELLPDNCMKYKPISDFIGIDTVCVKICDSTGFCVKKLYLIDVVPPSTLEGLLPLALYFDNDHPNPSSRKVKTEKSYLETVDDYLDKRNKFINEFIAPLEGAERAKARARIDSFFVHGVRAGRDSLKLFSDVLVQYMRFNQNVEIVLKGYTSPRYTPEYNYNLARRRISSAKNHFYNYRDGILMPFIKSGQLVISEKPFGETMAPEGVIEDLDDLRNSVYSVEASKERRLEIIEVKR